MKIWIDLSNSPHPLLFAPIARRLEELGDEVLVTARDNAQTIELTLSRWPDAALIGGPSPSARAAKARAQVDRVSQLRQWARPKGFDVAVSHNSYAQIVAARTLGLRVLTAMDYEGQPANHLGFRLAHLILLPEAMRSAGLRRQGAAPGRTRFYDGFKEEIYLGDFEPDPGVRAGIGLPSDGRLLAVARTPPTGAVYHRFENPLFEQALELLDGESSVRVVLLPRGAQQREEVRAMGLDEIVIPDRAVDSRSLMHEADLVLGAGGTMTREAALLGAPTRSVFAGSQPAVDRELERMGLLSTLKEARELVPVTPRPSPPRTVEDLRARAAGLIETFVQAVHDAGAR